MKKIFGILLFIAPLLSATPAWFVYQDDGPDSTAPPATKVDRSGELKIFSDLYIAPDEVRSGNLRVVGGKLTVAGTVTGRITVIGGSVEILSTARVEGTIIALGGSITTDPAAIVTGDVVEMNTRKISLSRADAAKIFEDDDDDERLEWRDADDDRDWHYEFSIDGPTHSLENHHSGFGALNEMGIPRETLFRYNRQEGAALYIPFSPDTYEIPGFYVNGFVGRAFGPGTWYGGLAIGEFLFRKRLKFVVEGHIRPTHDDGWRVNSLENFVAAFLIHEDYFDWYESEGYSASAGLNGPWGLSAKVSYADDSYRAMKNTAEWSIFGGAKRFRPAFEITEGRDITLNIQMNLGHPVGYYTRTLSGGVWGRQIETQPDGEFDYLRRDARVEAYLPLHRRLGIMFRSRTGRISDRSGNAGSQHMTPIGGLGSIGGYAYKSMVGSQFAIIELAFNLHEGDDVISLLWNYGNTWNSSDELFAGKYFDNLTNSDGRLSVGVGFGDYDTRLEIYHPLHKSARRDWVLNLRLIRQ